MSRTIIRQRVKCAQYNRGLNVYYIFNEHDDLSSYSIFRGITS